MSQRASTLMEILAEIDETFGEWWDVEWSTEEAQIESLEEWLHELDKEYK